MLVKLYQCLRDLLPKRKSHSEQALADLYKDTPKGNMSPDDTTELLTTTTISRGCEMIPLGSRHLVEL